MPVSRKDALRILETLERMRNLVVADDWPSVRDEFFRLQAEIDRLFEAVTPR